MQIVSAYLIAAAAVEEGNYDEDYVINDDPDFVEFMEDGDQGIVGDYIDLSVPTGGSEEGSFSGSKFCKDWLVAWVRPFEYRKIYDSKASQNNWYPKTKDDTQWKSPTPANGYYAYDDGWTNKLIPEFLDDQIFDEYGRHINFWVATVNVQYNLRMLRMYGAYVDKKASFRCVQNNPRQGYAIFSVENIQGSIYVTEYFYAHGMSDTGFIGNSNKNRISNFILVYNVNAFKEYLEGLDTATCLSMVGSYFALAECNIKKEKVSRT